MSEPRIRFPNLIGRWTKAGDNTGVEAFTPAKGEELRACKTCGAALRDHGAIGESRICPGDLIIGGGALRAWPLRDVTFKPVEEGMGV